ncbi:MAG TPA: lipid A-modifier LpxR family protein, partial [Roseococcus sp.]|nr:lipid A-modifier LpxR family protein [Roseococcus sp.]
MNPTSFFLALALTLGAALPVAAQQVRLPPPDRAGTLTFTTENDLFGGGTDRYYSSGALLTWR